MRGEVVEHGELESALACGGMNEENENAALIYEEYSLPLVQI